MGQGLQKLSKWFPINFALIIPRFHTVVQFLWGHQWHRLLVKKLVYSLTRSIYTHVQNMPFFPEETRQADVCNALCCKAMQQYVIWQQPVLHFMHCYDNHITTKSQCGVRCTKINIPIPYLVYASPTPGRKSWHNIMKQKSQSHKTTL